MDSRSYAHELESLVAELMRELGYRVEVEVRPDRTSSIRVDVVARGSHGIVIPIEVKAVSALRPLNLGLLRTFGSQTSRLRPFSMQAKPILALGARVNPDHLSWAESEYSIEIWDIDLLIRKAGASRPKFEDFLARARTDNTSSARPDVPRIYLPIEVAAASEASFDPEPKEPSGRELIERLKGTPAGRKHAKAYEEVCREIIGYLFGADLLDGRSQKKTSDGMNIYDLVYRVSPHNPFWHTLTRDFRARVVLFECKNYGKPIGAMQVLLRNDI